MFGKGGQVAVLQSGSGGKVTVTFGYGNLRVGAVNLFTQTLYLGDGFLFVGPACLHTVVLVVKFGKFLVEFVLVRK